jgi:hypothetical protein
VGQSGAADKREKSGAISRDFLRTTLQRCYSPGGRPPTARESEPCVLERKLVVTLSQLRDTARQEATKIAVKGGMRVSTLFGLCGNVCPGDPFKRYAAEVVCGTTRFFLEKLCETFGEFITLSSPKSLFSFLQVTRAMSRLDREFMSLPPRGLPHGFAAVTDRARLLQSSVHMRQLLKDGSG